MYICALLMGPPHEKTHARNASMPLRWRLGFHINVAIVIWYNVIISI